MTDIVKQLVEANVISEDVRESIETAWQSKLTEHRQEIATQLREEFAQRYNHDKQVMVEAVDSMLSDALTNELREFMDDRKQLAEAKVRYHQNIKEHTRVLQKFITQELANEVKELHEDQVMMADKFKRLETFVVEALAQEITEFFQDKQELAETRVRMIKEGRNEIKRVREQFVRRAAKLVESTVGTTLKSEMKALKEDIEASRRSDFGRRLFEAFASEYQMSYLNERSETSKLLKLVSTKDLAIQEAAEAVVKAEAALVAKQQEIVQLKEHAQRQKIMSELLAPLNRDQQEVMSELMETVRTERLTESFQKYLPAVLNDAQSGKQARKRSLMESKEITGDRIKPKTLSEDENNIIAIRRLAGLA